MYRWIDHTSEVELEVRADTEEEVFAESLRALAELLGFDSAVADGAYERRTVSVRVGGTDRTLLLVGWLEELVFLAESEGFVATALEDLRSGPAELTARVGGVLDDPPPLVKAVTLHRLAFERRGGQYFARVVLDV